jgi:hypothetical protein
MTTHVLLSSIVLTGLLLAAPIARADTAADTTGKRASPVGVVKSVVPKGVISSTTTGTLRTSKTSLGLRVDYAFDTPATGSTTEVRLRVEGNEAGRPLSIEVVPGAGLQMARGLPGNIAVQTVPSAEHVMAITPTTDGLHYIHVFLRSGDMTEALAIAVPTGKTQSLPKPVATKTMPDGRRVKSIPAQQ